MDISTTKLTSTRENKKNAGLAGFASTVRARAAPFSYLVRQARCEAARGRDDAQDVGGSAALHGISHALHVRRNSVSLHRDKLGQWVAPPGRQYITAR